MNFGLRWSWFAIAAAKIKSSGSRGIFGTGCLPSAVHIKLQLVKWRVALAPLSIPNAPPRLVQPVLRVQPVLGNHAEDNEIDIPHAGDGVHEFYKKNLG